MAANSDSDSGINLKIISFNMRGFHQGRSVIEDMIAEESPDVLLLQEHWLTPDNLYLFDRYFSGYFSFGSSAMSSVLETGMLRGRPYGGVLTLVRNNLRVITKTIFCSDRYAVIQVGDFVIINVYLPCAGSYNRQLVCDEVLAEIGAWCDRYSDCEFIFAGDLNVNLDSSDIVARSIINFSQNYGLSRCDDLFPCEKVPTYIDSALHQQSQIDYILVSSSCTVNSFSVADPDINFSDHLPLVMDVLCRVSTSLMGKNGYKFDKVPKQYFLRWDKADRNSYYRYTGDNITPLIARLDAILVSKEFDPENIDAIYADIVGILSKGAKMFVPKRGKQFFKFWWSEELSILKKSAMDSNKKWVAAGKPRSGPLYISRQQSRMNYRKVLRETEQESTLSYTNDLHEALMRKNGVAFWKCWKSKFECHGRPVEVDNCVDNDAVAEKFSLHFASSYTPNYPERAKEALENYRVMRATYCGFPLTEEHIIDTELVSNVISRLHNGKAPDIAGLSAEHLSYSHPALSVVLCKLFRIIVNSSYIPTGFKCGYIVPIPKLKDSRVKSLSCDDFRGIAISPVVSKVFEHCVLDRFQHFLSSCDAQFGFKKGVGCRNAIYRVRKIVDKFIEGGDTANICALDLTKAFDKVNHASLYMKLMKRHIPLQLLQLLENWLSDSFACVKWGSSWSQIFQITSGVRQGSVLSPFLFAIFIDDVGKIQSNRYGTYIILYADDILLVAKSVTALQRMLWLCEQELNSIDMVINVKKSCCMRVGTRQDKPCSNINTIDGRQLSWVNEIRYLGVVIVRSVKFKCSIDQAKKSFYRAANSIFAKVGRLASEEVVVELLKCKCLPILLYALEVCNLNKSTMQSLDFTLNRFFMKLFRTSNMEIVTHCQEFFGCDLPSVTLRKRCVKFIGTNG